VEVTARAPYRIVACYEKTIARLNLAHACWLAVFEIRFDGGCERVRNGGTSEVGAYLIP
jgi:hypothetical protein